MDTLVFTACRYDTVEVEYELEVCFRRRTFHVPTADRVIIVNKKTLFKK